MSMQSEFFRPGPPEKSVFHIVDAPEAEHKAAYFRASNVSPEILRNGGRILLVASILRGKLAVEIPTELDITMYPGTEDNEGRFKGEAQLSSGERYTWHTDEKGALHLGAARY